MGALDNVQLHFVNSLDEAQKFLTWLGQRRPNDAVAFDIETGEYKGHDKKDALSPYHGKIRLVQIGDGEQGWAIPWETWGGVFYQGMSQYTGRIVCHNIAFESAWMTENSDWKFPWHQAHDTMIMAHVIDPTTAHGLKPLAERLVDRTAALLQDTLKADLARNGWTWGTVPFTYDPYVMYSALDPVLTIRLFDMFWEKVKPGAPYAAAYELEMQTRRICTQMELRGARIDLDYSQQKLKELRDFGVTTARWAEETFGISITSTRQLGDKFEELGAKITSYTATGQKSVTKEQLEEFAASENAAVSALATAATNQRKADKLATAYFENFLNLNKDGLVHPSIRTLGARTGRMSITEPALQTLPSGSSIVRRAFVPRGEDEVIIASDLDQVEFRATAHFSGDKSLQQLFHDADTQGADVFTDIMRNVFKDQTLQKSDPRRKIIKMFVYAMLYAAGVEKLAKSAGVPIEEMQEIANGFDAAYPGVKQDQKRLIRLIEQREQREGVGYVETILTGRRLPTDPRQAYTGVNYRVQGSCAEVFKQNLIEIDQAGLGDFMMLPVHDEIVLSVPRSQAHDMMRTVQECMTTSDGWAVPLTAGADGPLENWGQKYDE
jgi:DNA polymerase-1